MSSITSYGNGVAATALQSLTGNSGGPVMGDPTNRNIDLLGAGGIIVTGNPATNTLTISGTGATFLHYQAVSSTPYVVDPAVDEYIAVDSSSIPITIQLPNSASVGQVFTIKDTAGNSFNNNITITTVGGVVDIDGATTFVINTNYEAIQVLWNGSAYEVF